MGMQIPRCVVSKVSIQDFDGRHWQISSRYYQAPMRMEANRNIRGQRADRPYPFGAICSAKILNFRDNRFHKREECHKNIRYASGAKETILGQALLGEGILCKHSWPR